MTHPYLRGTRTPRILAHRGLLTADAAASGVVDNSFAAVAAAHAAGVEYIESDCHLTSDGVVVLLHDEDLTRVAHDPRLVAEVALPELMEMLAERGGLLTLEQALESFPTLRFNLDVKVAGTEDAVGRLVAPHAERVLLTSFSDARRRAALAAAERAGAPILPATAPGSRVLAQLLAALAVRSRRGVDAALRGLEALQIPERHRGRRVLTPRLIDAAHARDVEVHVWTVNDLSDMERLLATGVDGLVTDRADVALTLVA